MYNHEPEGYICPFCLVVKGTENEHVYTRQADVVLRTNEVTAFIASHPLPYNPGQVLVVPNKHIENLYDLPSDISAKIHEVEREVALAMKEMYKCQGVAIRQHNEYGYGQDVFHYHLAIIPRFLGDKMYSYAEDNTRKLAPAEDRANYAAKLRTYFER